MCNVYYNGLYAYVPTIRIGYSLFNKLYRLIYQGINFV